MGKTLFGRIGSRCGFDDVKLLRLQILLCVNQITWTARIEEALESKDPAKMEAVREDNNVFMEKCALLNTVKMHNGLSFPFK
jgi:hypothetical protein